MLHSFWRGLEWVLSWGSGEFILRYRPNSGAVVLARALLITAVLYLGAVGIKERLQPTATWGFSASNLAAVVKDTLPWLGAVFGATYAALYTRFAAQWTYLANLYNQIMSIEAQVGRDPFDERVQVIAAWKAGFIEDAEDVHLALKPSYAGVILSFAECPGVPEAFARNTAGRELRLDELKKRAQRAFDREDAKRKARLASREVIEP